MALQAPFVPKGAPQVAEQAGEARSEPHLRRSLDYSPFAPRGERKQDRSPAVNYPVVETRTSRGDFQQRGGDRLTKIRSSPAIGPFYIAGLKAEVSGNAAALEIPGRGARTITSCWRASSDRLRLHS